MDLNKNQNEATPLLSGQSKDVTNAIERDDAISSTTSDKYSEAVGADADFFAAAELGIANVSPEQITENVEDIVQDLENLLGESSNSAYTFSKDNRLAESSNEINSSNDSRALLDSNHINDEVEDTEILCQATVGNSLSEQEQINSLEANFSKSELACVATVSETTNNIIAVPNEASNTGQIQINEVSTDTSGLSAKLTTVGEISKDAALSKDTNDGAITIDEFEIFQSTLTRNLSIDSEIPYVNSELEGKPNLTDVPAIALADTLVEGSISNAAAVDNMDTNEEQTATSGANEDSETKELSHRQEGEKHLSETNNLVEKSEEKNDIVDATAVHMDQCTSVIETENVTEIDDNQANTMQEGANKGIQGLVVETNDSKPEQVNSNIENTSNLINFPLEVSEDTTQNSILTKASEQSTFSAVMPVITETDIINNINETAEKEGTLQCITVKPSLEKEATINSTEIKAEQETGNITSAFEEHLTQISDYQTIIEGKTATSTLEENATIISGVISPVLEEHSTQISGNENIIGGETATSTLEDIRSAFEEHLTPISDNENAECKTETSTLQENETTNSEVSNIQKHITKTNIVESYNIETTLPLEGVSELTANVEKVAPEEDVIESIEEQFQINIASEEFNVTEAIETTSNIDLDIVVTAECSINKVYEQASALTYADQSLVESSFESFRCENKTICLSNSYASEEFLDQSNNSDQPQEQTIGTGRLETTEEKCESVEELDNETIKTPALQNMTNDTDPIQEYAVADDLETRAKEYDLVNELGSVVVDTSVEQNVITTNTDEVQEQTEIEHESVLKLGIDFGETSAVQDITNNTDQIQRQTAIDSLELTSEEIVNVQNTVKTENTVETKIATGLASESCTAEGIIISHSINTPKICESANESSLVRDVNVMDTPMVESNADDTSNNISITEREEYKTTSIKGSDDAGHDLSKEESTDCINVECDYSTIIEANKKKVEVLINEGNNTSDLILKDSEEISDKMSSKNSNEGVLSGNCFEIIDNSSILETDAQYNTIDQSGAILEPKANEMDSSSINTDVSFLITDSNQTDSVVLESNVGINDKASDSNSSSSADIYSDKNCITEAADTVAVTTFLYNATDDESTVTTTEMDIAMSSIMSVEPDAAVGLEEASTQLNLVTESASAVEALISAELCDNVVHSNTMEYSLPKPNVQPYKPPSFMTSAIPASKHFEPSVIELNCAVASILGESSNSVISELEFTPTSLNDVSTSSTTHILNPGLEETDITDGVQSTLTFTIPSVKLLDSDTVDSQVDLKDSSEQLVTQSNIAVDVDDAVQESEKTPFTSSEPQRDIEQTDLQSAELVQPLIVEVEENNFPEHRDSNVTSTQIEKTETLTEIASPESQKNRASLKITIGKDESLHSILKIYDPNEAESSKEETVIPKITIKPILSPVECHPSPKLTIKPIKPPEHSPKITIKPIMKPEPISPLKITLRPTAKATSTSPKLHMKTLTESGDISHHSPKITIKPILKPTESGEEIKTNNDFVAFLEGSNLKIRSKSTDECQDIPEEKCSSPKLIIKPIIKPPEEEDVLNSPKITIKPIIKPPEEEEVLNSPKITIKPIIKPSEEEEALHSPKITIKPIIKPPEEEEVPSSPKITIKPIIKPSEDIQCTEEKPKITIKPVVKSPEGCHSPKITIKPIIKPEEPSSNVEEKQAPRITIKPVINTDESESILSSHILLKSNMPQDDNKEQSTDLSSMQPLKLNIKPVVKPPETSILQSFLKTGELPKKPIELIDFEDQIKQERIILKIAKPARRGRPPLSSKSKLGKDSANAQTAQASKRSLSEESNQDFKHLKTAASLTALIKDENQGLQSVTKEGVGVKDEFLDPLAEIPVFEITPQSIAVMSRVPAFTPKPEITQMTSSVAPVLPMPRKRGRPRKVPLEVREEFKDPREEEVQRPREEDVQSLSVEELARPKRSCRGPSVRSTLGMKPRKPRGPRGRGRGGGSSRTARARASRKPKEPKLPAAPLGLFPEPMLIDSERTDSEIKDAEFKSVPLPTETGNNNREVVIYEEETRMSAENSSRAQTPAKQVLSSTEVVEESQSSVQSNATTESGEKTHKSRKGSRVEVHHEPEGEVLSADKLAEYSWGGGGPYMLQEQVAQFLGIKSFKRKYPGIQRRTVDMQERDFIRDSCLASEAMCDMGLTAVKSEDILDIMYTDFQHKYEEYCKHQRDRQAKDVSNKQKALSLAASQEKNKIDIVEQAIQSAHQWNSNFNKTRREQRRACMDLQTFTVHYPKGKMKQINKPSIGNYPLSLVPGQYSDYYKKYTARELSSLPLNTVGCGSNVDAEDSHSDGSGSDSDSSSSDSDSSSSGSSDDCRVCNSRPAIAKKQLVR